MATQTPDAPVKKPNAETPKPQLPLPDASSWKRYSQHGELPLSSVGSFALHILALGVIFIVGFGIFSDKKRKELPVEPIKIAGKGTGRGEGIGNNVGDGRDIEDGAGKGDGSQERGPQDDGNLKLSPDQIAALPIDIKNDPDAARAFQKGHPNTAVFSNLSDAAREKFRTGINPGGNGGMGNGGTTGGTSGDGPGRGSGRSMNEREKRMYRWRINFSRTTPADYLTQLHSMGAILGIPVGKDDYQLIRELNKRPAHVVKEDPTKLGLIYWFNNDPQWTAVVLTELGVELRPSHFVVFFPLDLEEAFAKAERDYGRLKEDQIEETSFVLVRKGKAMVPVVESQKKKR